MAPAWATADRASPRRAPSPVTRERSRFSCRLSRRVALPLAIALGSASTAACGGGDSGEVAPSTKDSRPAEQAPSSSFVDLLATMPASLLDTTGPAGDTPFFVTVGDTERAEAAAQDLGVAQTGPRTTDSVRRLTIEVGATVPTAALRSPEGLADAAGFDIAGVDRFAELSRAPDDFVSAAGSFDPAAIGEALGASAFWGPTMEERAGGPMKSWVWGDDSMEIDVEGVDALHPIGRAVQIAADENRLLLSARIATLDDALDVLDAGAPSLADEQSLSSVAAALDDRGVFAAHLSTSPWTFSEATVLLDTDQRAAAGAEPHLGAYTSFAIGAALDGGDLAIVVVLAHESEDDAEANEALLSDVLAEGHDWASPTAEAWSEAFARADVSRNGTVVTAVLVPAEPAPARWTQMFQIRTPLVAIG